MKMVRVFLVSVSVALTVLTSAWGGDAGKPETITIKQAIDKAVSNNPKLGAASFRLESADAGITKADSGYLPRVEVSETFQRTTNPMWAFGHKLNQESITAADFAPDKLNNPDAVNNWGTALTLTQPVYTGGKLSAYSAQARLNKEASLKEMESVRQGIIFDVTRAYYGIALAEANQEVIKEVVKTAEANMEMSRSLLKAGVVVESDFLSARVNWADAMEDDIRAANAVVIGKAQLNILMGVEIGEQFEPSDSLLNDVDKISQEYNQLMEKVNKVDPTAERPEYAVLKYRQEMTEKGLEAAKADNMPTVGLMANYEIDGKDPLSGDGNNWTVMGVLKWNLFNGNESTARIKEARAESKRIKEVTREFGNGIRLEVLSARLELKASRDRVYVAKDSVRQAEEGYRIVKNRYNEGMTTMVDLLNSGTALKKARLSLTQAIYDYKVGEARLMLALGILK